MNVSKILFVSLRHTVFNLIRFRAREARVFTEINVGPEKFEPHN